MDYKKPMAAYLRTIRNANKRTYAVLYASYLTGHRNTEPQRPDGLCNMAAQAVRIQLHAIIQPK